MEWILAGAGLRVILAFILRHWRPVLATVALAIAVMVLAGCGAPPYRPPPPAPAHDFLTELCRPRADDPRAIVARTLDKLFPQDAPHATPTVPDPWCAARSESQAFPVPAWALYGAPPPVALSVMVAP